jgi:hypothetical protein
MDCIFDRRQQLFVMLDRLLNEPGVEAVRYRVALVFGTLLTGRFGEAGFAFFRAQLEEARAECGGKGQDRAGIVHMFLDQLVEEAHLRARERCCGHQRLLGKGFVKV